MSHDPALFGRAVAAGSRLLFLHTYGDRFTSKERKKGQVPRGSARCTVAVSDAPADYPDEYRYDPEARKLYVGAGVFAPVAPAVWEYQVSGLFVVDSWLGYRMKNRKGKKSSPLDAIHPERWTGEFTEELLRLLWILEQTVGMHGELAGLLGAVCAGPLLPAAELPAVPEPMRKPPRAGTGGSLFDVDAEDADE